MANIGQYIENDKWAVEAFRYSSARKQWELFQQGTAEKERLTVTPKKHCIELKMLHLRIYVAKPPDLPQASTSSGEGTQANDNVQISEKKKFQHVATVVKRRDTILISKEATDQSAFILKFRSLDECDSFVDRLCELNHDLVYEKDMDKVVQRSKTQLTNRNSVAAEYHRGETVESDNEAEKDQSFKRYFIKLLHDEEFLSFVNHLEDSLSSDKDCMKMLEAKFKKY